MQDYIKSDIHKKIYKRETLLNYALSRWGMNKSASIGKTSDLIRKCHPGALTDWETFYFQNAIQNKKNGLKITENYIVELDKSLYLKLSEIVHNELSSITEEECIDYVYNLIINRTYDGYVNEIETIYGQLEKILNLKIESASDEWDRKYNIDFFIKIKESFIGLQIKPITGKSINDYQWDKMHQASHLKFKKQFNGNVFFIFSGKSATKKKEIINIEVISDIKKEIERLQNVHKS